MPSLPLISCHSWGLPPLGFRFYLIVISGYFQQTRASRLRQEDQKGQMEVAYYKSEVPDNKESFGMGVSELAAWKEEEICQAGFERSGSRTVKPFAELAPVPPCGAVPSEPIQSSWTPGRWVLWKFQAQLGECIHSQPPFLYPSKACPSESWPFLPPSLCPSVASPGHMSWMPQERQELGLCTLE